jgi:hypothetical protein
MKYKASLLKILIGIIIYFARIAYLPAQIEAPSALPSSFEIYRPFGNYDKEAFLSPPKVYYPETWFHYIGGNISKEGITTDLEAIAKVGISGIQLFHGQFGGPWPGVEPQITCLSPNWEDIVQHTAQECRRLGLRFVMLTGENRSHRFSNCIRKPSDTRITE